MIFWDSSAVVPLLVDESPRDALLEVGGVDAVDDEAVVGPAPPVDGEAGGDVLDGGPRGLRGQAQEVASPRHLVDELVADGGERGALLHVDHGRVGGDGHRLLHGAQREGDVDPQELAEGEPHVGPPHGSEALEVDLDLPAPGGERREAVEAFSVERLRTLTRADVCARCNEFADLVRFDPITL